MRKLLFIFFLSSIAFAQEVTTVNQLEIDTAKKIAQDFYEKENIAGMAISVSKKGALIWSEGFGYADIATKKKIDPAKTQFRIASISKSLTAVALAKLMDENQLSLDASLYTYLPDYPKKKHDFTIRQIGGHIAGIRHYRGTEFILNKKMNITEGLDIFKNDPLLSKPGSKYNYSTYGWNLLSEVIQKITGSPFNDYMTKSIFNPLKMFSTTTGITDSIMPNRTKFYIKTNAGEVILGPEVNNEFKAAGGGFIATAEDLVRFGNEIVSPKLISKNSFAELFKEQKTTDGKGIAYGVGFRVGLSENGTPKYGHSGGGIGASTYLLVYPKEKIVITILTNVSRIPVRELSNKLGAVFLN